MAALALVEPGAGHAEELAHLPHRSDGMLLTLLADHGATLGVRGVLAYFFRRAFSNESCPQKSSSSATVCSSKAVNLRL